jgi:hypothetical protein
MTEAVEAKKEIKPVQVTVDQDLSTATLNKLFVTDSYHE